MLCNSSERSLISKEISKWSLGLNSKKQISFCNSFFLKFETGRIRSVAEITTSRREWRFVKNSLIIIKTLPCEHLKVKPKFVCSRVAHGNYRGIAANGENRQIFYVKFKDFWCKSGGQKTNLRGEVWPPKSDGRYFWNLTWNHFMRQALKCSDKFVTICESLVKTAYLRSIKQKSTPNFDWNFWLFDALYKTIALWL